MKNLTSLLFFCCISLALQAQIFKVDTFYFGSYGRVMNKVYTTRNPATLPVAGREKLCEMNTTTGAIEQCHDFGNPPFTVFMADDDKTLFVSIINTNEIVVFNTETRTVIQRFPAQAVSGNDTLFPIQILPLKGTTNKVVAGLCKALDINFDYESVALYENGVALPDKLTKNDFGGSPLSNIQQFNDTLLAGFKRYGREIYYIKITPTGLKVGDRYDISFMGINFELPYLYKNRLFHTEGRVADVSNLVPQDLGYIDTNYIGARILYQYDKESGVLAVFNHVPGTSLTIDLRSVYDYSLISSKYIFGFTTTLSSIAYEFNTWGKGRFYCNVDYVSSFMQVPVTGMTELSINTNSQFKIYPNPSLNDVTLISKQEIQTLDQLSILDLSGKTIAEYQHVALPFQLPGGQLPKGTYLLRCLHAKGQETIKLIKN